ncbi:MAG: hypothetical protein IT467_03765 [Dokdonella sp.]|uniref:hypothetical protein n=1 Tax=Dokdonella sp. TaxID=2291710 RepID=UPI0025C72DB5|nr:hypothetical protein [Dokdonella sp.]MBZ0221484.1 hypothetical protein [Dokdonella sp.]MCC7255031.1 hypothetical protein [Dokdonella sp.]
MNTFTVIDDHNLTRTIAACRRRLVYIAPGVTLPVAEAIGLLLDRKEAPAITIIVDSDPEVYRLGYGTIEGLKALQALIVKYQISLRQQPGLRIGVLACDDALVVYSPTPLLIEAGSHSELKPNAISIGRDPLAQLLDAAAAEGGDHDTLPSDAEIGCAPLTPEALKASLADIEKIPPKSFDVSRVERVFNAQLQYVELEVTGYKLSSRKVSIPNDLLIGEDADLEKRLRNTFSLLEGKTSLEVEIDVLDQSTLEPKLDASDKPQKAKYSEKVLEADRKKLYEGFLTNVVNHGWLIKRWDRPALDQRLEWFRKRIEAYRDGVKKQLEESVQKSIRELAQTLLPKLKDRFPERLRKRFSSADSNEKEMLSLLECDLSEAFGRAHQQISPNLKVTYKDLTYETIKDEKFRAALEAAYGHPDRPSVIASLFKEYDAAPEAAS